MQVSHGGCNRNGAAVAKEVASTSNGDGVRLPINLTETDKEVVRLIGQHLGSLGLIKSTETLISESGCHLEHSAAAKFRQQTLEGQWSKVETTLTEMKGLLKHQRHLQKMRFFVMEQKYLELVEEGKLLEALTCLRTQITPLRIFVNRVHQLSGFLMLSSPQELYKAANWGGKGVKTRSKLLDKLQGYLPISVMLPPDRLNALLSQAISFQQMKCLFHNSPNPPQLQTCSLLVDHNCLCRNFPSSTRQILSDHGDEVWFCKFSNNGRFLATGSKGSAVIIWNVDPTSHVVSRCRNLMGPTYGIGFLAWSPDDQFILACGTEESSELWLWNAQSGELCTKISNSAEDSLGCCSWSPDGKRFVTGGSKGQFYQCDMDGTIIESWEGVRVQSLGCLPDNKTVLAADTQQRIRAYNFDDMTDTNLIKEDHPVMSFTVSTDGKSILLNVATQGVHLWDVEDKLLVRKYQGVVQGFYTIFSTFGGVNDEYIASGSEDNKVYIWHRSREKSIEKLTGHTKTVNCVSWNKAIPSMLASVSDDGTVRIWGPQDSTEADSADEEEVLNPGNDI